LKGRCSPEIQKKWQDSSRIRDSSREIVVHLRFKENTAFGEFHTAFINLEKNLSLIFDQEWGEFFPSVNSAQKAERLLYFSFFY